MPARTETITHGAGAPAMLNTQPTATTPGKSVTASAGAPPTSGRWPRGRTGNLPPCPHCTTALALRSGGIRMPYHSGPWARSIAPRNQFANGHRQRATRRVKILVVDPHAIFRRVVVASLELLERVESVDQAEDISRAQCHP